MKDFDKDNMQTMVKESWSHAFEAGPSQKNRFYLTVAYPYPSGAMHVGHGRTYIVPDVIARYRRMQGDEVLYPMAFHVTGSPVIGISKRISQKDEKTISLYRDLYRVPEDVLKTFEDPMKIVRYFSNEYQRVMGDCGLSVDWRRRFTTIDPHYSKFIEWQYCHLYRQDRVARGAHPVKYCPMCDNPVGDHDLLEGDASEIIRFTLVMFSLGDAVLPCATLRPETTYGVTNLWLNPSVEYVKAKVDDQIWIISREAADKIAYQDHDLEVITSIPGSELLDMTVSHPFCGDVPILPANFVDPEMGTGVVMSVPAHAPFDYIALRDLQMDGRYRQITPVQLIEVDGYGRFPAQDAVERAGIKSQNDDLMESLTQEVYNAEFTGGRLLEKYGGLPVREARDAVAQEMVESYGSVPMYDFDNRNVVCRCGSRVFVRILHDQWFLQYSDPGWKAEVHDQIDNMSIVPSEVRAEFHRTVDWLKDWACTRRVGLGTKLPWDKSWIVEPLSDSTIYMAYYTVSYLLKELDPGALTPEFFDAVFLGMEVPDDTDADAIRRIRGEFLYWYPYNYRFSAKDLISNHLTFQLFHHQAIFPDDCQPEGMVVFGMGLLNGAKMSSSKGNVFLLEDAVREFGADTVRMFLIGSAEPWQDFDWRNELVSSTRKQIERFWNMAREATSADGEYPIDMWLMSRLQKRIMATTGALDAFQTRQALQESFFGIEADLKWYRRRLPESALGGRVLRRYAENWVRLLAPIIPFVAESLWKEMGGNGLVSFAPWPLADESLINESLELSEELLLRTTEDIESIIRLIPLQAKKVAIIIAPEWKKRIFDIIAGSTDRKKAVSEVMKDETLRSRGKEAAVASKQITNHIHRLPPDIVRHIAELDIDEANVFDQARGFIAKEYGLEVKVEQAETCAHTKASAALPFKPAILIE